MTVNGIGKPPGCKLIRVTAEVDAGTIRSVSIRGDFFAFPEEGFERVEAALNGTAADDLARRFDELLGREGVEAYGIDGGAVAAVFDPAYEAIRKER